MVDVVFQDVWVSYRIKWKNKLFLKTNKVFLRKQLKTWSLLLITQKQSMLYIWGGSEHASTEKQGTCKVCKKNSRRRYVKCKSTWYMFWNISMILANLWFLEANSEAYSEPCQRSKTEVFANIVNEFLFLIIFLERLIWDVLQGGYYGIEKKCRMDNR